MREESDRELLLVVQNIDANSGIFLTYPENKR